MTKVNTHKLALKFFDFDCSPDELTQLLSLEPTETAIKGQANITGRPQNEQIKTWPFNFWMYQIIFEEHNHLMSEQLNSFVDNIIKPRLQLIKEIVSTCDSEFSIVQYVYEGCNPGFHFDNNILKIIAETGVEIDLDIYIFESE